VVPQEVEARLLHVVDEGDVADVVAVEVRSSHLALVDVAHATDPAACPG
jgi:hypothetical protein